MKINIKLAVIAAANLIAFAVSSILLSIGGAKAETQKSQYAAERWMNGNSAFEYSQISCFFKPCETFDIGGINQMRGGIDKAMTDASLRVTGSNNEPDSNKTVAGGEDANDPAAGSAPRLWIDAYCGVVGKFPVTGSRKVKPECLVTAADGDFFLIHDFKLINGAFYSMDDLMYDGAVIDRMLAWQVFGSDDVAGMNIILNGKLFYISGVIDTPRNKTELECYGTDMRAYISYEGAAYMLGGEFAKVECYESVLPNPVKGFALNIIKDKAEGFGAVVVENTGRFSVNECLGKIKALNGVVTRTESITFPWWENAALMTEFTLSFLYLFAAIFLIIPIVTLIVLIVKAYKAFKRKKPMIKRFILNRIDAVLMKRRIL